MKIYRNFGAALMAFLLCSSSATVVLAQPVIHEGGDTVRFSAFAYRNSSVEERAKEKLRDAGYPEEQLDHIPAVIIPTAANAVIIQKETTYYVEETQKAQAQQADSDSRMVRASKEKHTQTVHQNNLGAKSLVRAPAYNNEAVSFYSDQGALTVSSFVLYNNAYSTFGALSSIDWSSMPKYRGTDYLAISHTTTASPNPNDAGGEYFFEYTARKRYTNASGKTSYTATQRYESKTNFEFNQLFVKNSNGYAMKMDMPQDVKTIWFLPNTMTEERKIENFHANIAYNGSPTYLTSGGFINHWSTYFHQYKIKVSLDGISISIPLGGGVSISNEKIFNNFVVEGRYYYPR